MIQRYSRPAMREIWSEQRKLEIWLQIELLVSEALCAAGLVPRKDFAQMRSRAAFSIDRCKELERTLNHDVIAFTTNVAENIGAPARPMSPGSSQAAGELGQSLDHGCLSGAPQERVTTLPGPVRIPMAVGDLLPVLPSAASTLVNIPWLPVR